MQSSHNVPESAMVIMAHPDDAEFTVAGTVAAWTKAGCRVVYVLCTDGNAGSHEPGMTREKLAEIRRAEQRAACATLGVSAVEFLGYDDGQLQPSLDLRRDLVRVIRQHKPEVMICWDPTIHISDTYINHPDHRAAAQVALDAVAPSSGMPLLWPETGAPHRVRQVYIYGQNRADTWIDITETIEQKIAALKQHASQMGDWDPTEHVKEWSAETGKDQGLAYAESYKVITLERHDTDDKESSAPEPDQDVEQEYKESQMRKANSMMEKVNVLEKLALFDEHWSPKIVGALNDSYVKLAKLKGEFIWHHHEAEDELFYVVKGRLLIRFRDKNVWLDEGEFIVVPRGAEHQPVAEEEVHVMLLEPQTTVNTGNVESERTTSDQWL